MDLVGIDLISLIRYAPRPLHRARAALGQHYETDQFSGGVAYLDGGVERRVQLEVDLRGEYR